MEKTKSCSPLTILLAADGSQYSDSEAKLVADIPWPAGTTVHVLAVVPERLPLIGVGSKMQRVLDEKLADVRRKEWAAAQMLAARVADGLRPHGLATQIQVHEGRAADVILEQAATLSADLIVTGARGLSAPCKYRLGSTAHKLVHYADCSVLVVRPPERTRLLSTMIATDRSSGAHRAAELLCALSLPQWAEVTVISVGDARVTVPFGIFPTERHFITCLPEALHRTLIGAAEARVDEMAGRLRDCGAQVQGVVRFGHPAQEIISAGEELDTELIVVGAHGQTHAGPYRMGGVAQKVVKYASCSVLVVR